MNIHAILLYEELIIDVLIHKVAQMISFESRFIKSISLNYSETKKTLMFFMISRTINMKEEANKYRIFIMLLSLNAQIYSFISLYLCYFKPNS